MGFRFKVRYVGIRGQVLRTRTSEVMIELEQSDAFALQLAKFETAASSPQPSRLLPLWQLFCGRIQSHSICIEQVYVLLPVSGVPARGIGPGGRFSTFVRATSRSQAIHPERELL